MKHLTTQSKHATVAVGSDGSGSTYTCRDYMDAMVTARRERDDLSSKLMSEAIDAHEWLETLAKAVGIQTGRESWWESNEEQQRAKVLERIKRLRANDGGEPRSPEQK